LTNFGINQTELAPGAVSALAHYHSKQDEFIYILQGTPTVLIDNKEHVMEPGDCVGFKAGTGIAHQLANKSAELVVYLEIGDKTPLDEGAYPNDDLTFKITADGTCLFAHKDGTPY